jgi:hypothetical protein
MARLLRAGAWTSGALFAAALFLETLPVSAHAKVAIDILRKTGASLLLATPVVALVAAGAWLARRGEYRQAALAAAVVGLLGIALGVGFAG